MGEHFVALLQQALAACSAAEREQNQAEMKLLQARLDEKEAQNAELQLELEHAVKGWGEAVEASERADTTAREAMSKAEAVIEAAEMVANALNP